MKHVPGEKLILTYMFSRAPLEENSKFTDKFICEIIADDKNFSKYYPATSRSLQDITEAH